jgi:hypothetical protein
MIWNDYEIKVKAIPKEQFNSKEYVTERIGVFVGTQVQINVERARLVIEAKEKELDIRTRYYAQYNAIMAEYKTKLYGDYNLSVEILDMAYAHAYERGHSSGYSEIEGIFYEVISDYAKAYDLGLKDGRNGK